MYALVPVAGRKWWHCTLAWGFQPHFPAAPAVLGPPNPPPPFNPSTLRPLTDNTSHSGLIPRICKALFAHIRKTEPAPGGGAGGAGGAAGASGTAPADDGDGEELKLYKVEVSYIEIYSECGRACVCVRGGGGECAGLSVPV